MNRDLQNKYCDENDRPYSKRSVENKPRVYRELKKQTPNNLEFEYSNNSKNQKLQRDGLESNSSENSNS